MAGLHGGIPLHGSPSVFWTSLVVGSALAAVGVAWWIAHGRIAVLAIGLGLVLGFTPPS